MSDLNSTAEPGLTHTPGDWVAIQRTNPAGQQQQWWEVVVQRVGTEHTWNEDLCMVFDSTGHAEGNAKLMAQAPAMLDALRAFCGDYEATPTTNDTSLKAAYLRACEVIANATGATPAGEVVGHHHV